jgi:RNA recognition motif-containing protein
MERIDEFLRALFGAFGSIEAVSISKFSEHAKSTRNSRFAHVVFERREALQRALSAPEEEYARNTSKVSQRFGLAKQCAPKTKQRACSSRCTRRV